MEEGGLLESLPSQLQGKMEKTVSLKTAVLVGVSLTFVVAVWVSLIVVAFFRIQDQASAPDIDGPGYVSVHNSGNYITMFYVAYKFNGTRKREDSGDFFPGFKKIISIPEEAKSVSFKVSERYYGSDTVNDIFSETFPRPVKMCYTVSGERNTPNYARIKC